MCNHSYDSFRRVQWSNNRRRACRGLDDARYGILGMLQGYRGSGWFDGALGSARAPHTGMTSRMILVNLGAQGLRQFMEG